MGSFSYPDSPLLDHYFSFCQLTYFWKGDCQDPIFKLSRCSVFGYTANERDLTIISHEPPLFPYVTFLFSLLFFFFSSIDSERELSLRLNSIFSLSIPGKFVVAITLSASSKRRQMETRLRYIPDYPSSEKS